ncbi:hypothetical protein O1L44_24475 [Streptomyces noursei]|nr:hypothetical protein [Streptomyces noursei]
MSNGSAFPPTRRSRGPLLIVLAVVVAVGVGGWLLWRPPGGGLFPAGGAASGSPSADGDGAGDDAPRRVPTT